MQRYFARIVRALIISSLGFGGGVGLLVFIGAIVLKQDPRALEHGLQAGAVIGGIFAVMLVGVLLPLDITAHLFLSKGRYNELWELEQTRELCFEGSLKDLMYCCRQALLAVPYVKTVTEDAENLVVRSSIGVSWRSGGEAMEVLINPVSEGKWHVSCTSRSSKGPVLFDYGKNFENVETWLNEMNTRMNRLPQTA